MSEIPLLLAELRKRAAVRTFGTIDGDKRLLAKHYYLLALEELERGLDSGHALQTTSSPRHDAA